MVVYPYLVNNGFLIYKDLINPYPPVFIIFLSLFSKIFGYSPQPYQILTWAVIIVVDLSIFNVVRKISKNYYHAFFALLLFVIFSLPFGINGLWFDLIQVPFVIFSVYHFYLYLEFKKTSYLNKSFYLAIATFFIKQQAAWIIIFYLGILLYKNRASPQKLIQNLILPFAFSLFLLTIHLIVFYKLGILRDFVFWAVILPFFKASAIPGYVALPALKQLLIVLIPFTLVVFSALNAKTREYFLIICALPVALFAYPRFDYFHLIAYLAIIAIALGIQLKSLKNLELKQLYLPIIAIGLLSIFTIHYFQNNWLTEIRFFEPDIQSSAHLLSIVTSPQEKIYIQNGPDQLLPLSKRLPIKPWAIQFPWYFEVSSLQSRTISAIESQKPQFIVYKPYEGKEKYALGSYMPSILVTYLDTNYINQIQISDTLWLKSKN